MLDLTKLPPRALRAYLAAVRNSNGESTASLSGTGVDHPMAHVPPPGAPIVAGLVPSDDDVRDYVYVPSGRFPLYEMDFRPECPPIRDQGQVGACTAFHVDSHCGRYAVRGKMTETAFSTRANYAMSRQLMGLTGDSGASLRAAIHAAYKYGIPTESQYPYGTNWQAIINTTTLPDAIMQEAAQNKIDSYYRIDLDNAYLNDPTLLNRRINRSLADGMTVGIGIMLHYWFYFVKGPLSTHAAVRNNPPPGATTWGKIIGAHAMCIVGRSDSLGGYIVRNQWGTGWGDNGYYLLPYGDTAEAFEFWAVKGFDGSDINLPPYDLDCAEAKAARLYRAAFARYPDESGLAFQTDVVSKYGQLAAAYGFMNSPEFTRIYGAAVSDGDFVNALYKNALLRSPDVNGFQYQCAALAGGMPRAQLLVNFAESPECRAMV